MTTYTDKIGVGGGFASLSLWHGTSASVPVSGDIMDVEFLSGTHDIGGTYNNFTATDLTINLKAHASALHNGEWGGPVQITWSTRPDWYFDDQTINLNLNDLVIKMTSNNFLLWYHVGTSGSSAGYDSNITFNRCLISNWSQDYSYISVAYLSLFDGPAASPTAYGTFKWEMNNCVVEQQSTARNLLFNSDSGVTNPYYAQKRYFNGCTFKNVSFNDRSTDNGPLDVQVSGCMNDSGTTRLVPVITASPYTATVTDYITSEANTGAQFSFWATGTNTNVSTAASFNYDGTVTAGEVCFVGPSGPEGNYRLVSDVDNLAVRYMDLSSIVTARDVANVKRCGSTDAGAFQSVSDRVLSATIPTEYASFDVFAGALGVGEFLNGDTLHILYEDGVHNTFGNLYTTNLDHTAGREVDLNIIVEGENHHQGYWSSGAIFKAIGTMQHGRQTTSYLWKNIVIDNDNHPNWPYRHNKYAGDVTYQYGHYLNQYETDEVYDDTITFENCLIRMNANSFLQGKYDSSIDDRPNEHPKSDPNTKPLNYSNSLSNIVKAGTISTNYKNCAIESIIPGLAFDGFDVPFYQIRKTSLVGCSVKNIGLFGLTWPSESTVELSGCLIDTSGADHFITYGWHGSTYLEQQPHFTWTDCIFTDTSSNSDLFRSYSYQIPAGSGALENSIASGYINNCTFGVPFNYDNTITGGEVCFVGSANSSALDFRLVPTEDNLASGYVSSFALSGLDLASNSRGDSPYDAGAFAITPEQVEDYIKRLGGPLVLQVGYRISNNRQIFIPVIGGGE